MEYILCLNCFQHAYYMHAGRDDFGEYGAYCCEDCGEWHNVYDLSESGAVHEALVYEALSDKTPVFDDLAAAFDTGERGIVFDDDDPFLSWYDGLLN